MKKVYQEIMMTFYVEDEADIDYVLLDRMVAGDIDWQFGDLTVEER
jgi:hypothetical protein